MLQVSPKVVEEAVAEVVEDVAEVEEVGVRKDQNQLQVILLLSLVHTQGTTTEPTLSATATEFVPSFPTQTKVAPQPDGQPRNQPNKPQQQQKPREVGQQSFDASKKSTPPNDDVTSKSLRVYCENLPFNLTREELQAEIEDKLQIKPYAHSPLSWANFCCRQRVVIIYFGPKSSGRGFVGMNFFTGASDLDHQTSIR